MRLFKMIEIDMDAERKRIKKNGVYNKREQKALLKLCDLFEAGKWDECLKHVNDEKAFPYNDKAEYSEKEHINPKLSDVLFDLKYDKFFTVSQIIMEGK